MIIQQFILWARTAPDEHRAEAVGALTRAVLGGDLLPEDQREAELALLAMLDDPSAAVRLAIAEALADAENAPRAIVAALLEDESPIACAILEHSPVLADSDLIDQVAIGDEAAQLAIARRSSVSPGLAGAIAEVGSPSAVLALLDNPRARLAAVSLARIVERFGGDPAIRGVLLARPDLPIEIRLGLVTALSRSLLAHAGSSASGRGERWARTTLEARERTIVALAEGCAADVLRRIVAHLRVSGELTPTLLLRAAVARNLSFVQAAFLELTSLAPRRVGSLLAQTGPAQDALYDRAGLPRSMKPAFLSVLSGLHEPTELSEGPGLSRRLIERALGACLEPESEAVTSLLRRFEAEAVREEARLLARTVVQQANLLELATDDLQLKAETAEASAPPEETPEADLPEVATDDLQPTAEIAPASAAAEETAEDVLGETAQAA